MRGVPREREAISRAASASIWARRMSALRETIFPSSWGVYSSSRSTTPNLSRKGADSCPARVVAPTKVNRGKGR